MARALQRRQQIGAEPAPVQPALAFATHKFAPWHWVVVVVVVVCV